MRENGPSIVGRGAAGNPKNRFETLEIVPDYEDLDPEELEPEKPATVYLKDHARSIVTPNDSPDIGFDAGISPYRGCSHGCAYCFSRPNHEYLGLSAGLDFETKILVKENAPDLLRKKLFSPRWEPKALAMSDSTDVYQPIEKKLRLTRCCLEVLTEFRNPVVIITKNHLVTRDLDLLSELARHDAVSVNISLTTLDDDLRRVMEPRTSSPKRRLAAIEKLAGAGVPVGALTAPIIPGLNDHELPSLLRAASDAGARFAGYTPVRLPYAVAPLFEDWLDRHFPDRKDKVLNHIREIRGGKLNDPRFGSRMSGEGVYAEHIARLFEVGCRRAGLNNGRRHSLSTAAFRRFGQPTLFN
ncbi:MAG: PA0069 family radical SAM protein [Rubrobacteraceae bacterium]